MLITKQLLIFITLAVTLPAIAQPPNFSADVPDSLITPEKVETEFLGPLEYFDGMPTDYTVMKAYKFLDLSRGVESFLNGMPAASMYAVLEGIKDAGAKPGELLLFEDLMDARSLFLTANSTTMYAIAEIDLKNGPVTVEIPPEVLGLVDDAFFRHVTDVGITGPDKGRGGKYLFTNEEYVDEIPDQSIIIKSKTYRHLLLMRAFAKEGNLKTTAENIKENFRCYPAKQANDPPQQIVHKVSGKQFNTIHANNATFFDELNAVIQYEPADAFNPELVGTFAAIGIKKGHAFAPDKRMKKILNDAAAIANASARSLVFRPRKENLYFYPDRQWYSPFAGGNHEFTHNGEMVLDDRVMFHYYATGITPAMVEPKIATGSVYAMTAHDSNGNYLDGSKTYSLTLPGPVPVNDFWSLMVYSGQHRSMLETDQKKTGIDSNSPLIKPNEDGSYTIFFSPVPNGENIGNWIQTMPGKSFNIILRLYGPLQPWFDKTWKPADMELQYQTEQ